jgi:peroxiredoxin
VKAQLYVEPDYVYGIRIPRAETPEHYKNDLELNVKPIIMVSDTTELNNLMFDYEQMYNHFFMPGNGSFISRSLIFKLADSLQLACDKRFEPIKNKYFKSYLKYAIANINASVSRGENYLANAYIKEKPILYNHYEYMLFFNSFFKGYLLSIAAQQKGQSLFNIVNVKYSYKLLNDFASKNWLLKNDTLRELVLIHNLWQFYFSPEFSPEGVKSIVNQLALQTKIKEHQLIIREMQAYFNKLRVNSEAPDFSARTPNGKMASLSSYKGKWVYLNFFSTNNIESLKEMPKILELKKKYGYKVSFISICLDDSLKSYNKFLKDNSKYDWPIWFNNEKSLTKTAKQKYSVAGDEAYFLISNQGLLAQSPAISPSAGIEFRFNILFKIKKKEFKTGIR